MLAPVLFLLAVRDADAKLAGSVSPHAQPRSARCTGLVSKVMEAMRLLKLKPEVASANSRFKQLNSNPISV
jgi:hypothetical protein